MSKGDGQEGSFWENHSWPFPDSDNSGGADDQSEKQVPKLNNGKEKKDKVVQATGRKKSERSKNGKGIIDPEIEGKGGGASGGGDGPSGGGDGGGGGESDHEIHIFTERERRKKMRDMFSNLHDLLPRLPPKTDKCTIVEEAINYTRTLQQTLQALHKKNLDRLRGVSSMNNCNNSMVITPHMLPMTASRESYLADQGGSLSNSSITPTNSGTSPIVPRFPICFQTWTSPNVTISLCGNDAHISVCSIKKPGLLSSICILFEKYRIEVVTAQVSTDQYRSLYMFQTHFIGGACVEDTYKAAVAEIIMCLSS